jgi:predicted ATP-dependent serine protease
MAANRLQYPCNGCGVLGHRKWDGECNPADVSKYIKSKMEEQAKKDEEEEGEDTGMNIYLAEFYFIGQRT